MSKELEALEHIYYGSQGYGETDKYYKFLKNYLESIDNSNPSEALECLEKLKGMEISSMPFSDEYGTQEVDLNDIRKVGSQLNTDFREYTTTIKQALQRLEAIDNAEPSQALECLDRLDNTLCLNNIEGKLEFGIDTEEHTDCDSVIGMTEDLETIKNFILKAQEPKKYLKWEDLEFKHKPVFTEAKMGETIYKLVIGFDCTGKETIFLRTDNQQIVFHEKDKQFFNDLHLERVEE